MSAEEVYRMVSPSIPFIETDTGTGSGILIEGGFVVTNYHVVWPHESAWVVFPDGTELQDVRVVGWDPMADLSVLGPVHVSARPLDLDDGEDMAIGSELYLVGYPAEVDLFPEPSITRGILSRFREWDSLGMTYLQTDATIVGGRVVERWSTRMGLWSAYRVFGSAKADSHWLHRRPMLLPLWKNSNRVSLPLNWANAVFQSDEDDQKSR